MIFPLMEPYRIETVPYNFILQRKKTKGKDSTNHGDVYWENIAFHGNLKSLLKALATRGIQGAAEFEEFKVWMAEFSVFIRGLDFPKLTEINCDHAKHVTRLEEEIETLRRELRKATREAMR